MVATALVVLLARLLVPVDRVDLLLRNGQTIGMRTWRIAVRADTGSLSLKAALLRALVGLFLPGLLWCLFDPRHRALHDRVAGTHVVQIPKR